MNAKIFLLIAIVRVAHARLKIINGQSMTIERVPWLLAFLSNGPSGQFVCGASIISSNFALTAAHCTFEYSRNIYLRAGSTTRDKNGTLIKVAKIIRHPQFDITTFDYDFSLLQFDQKIIFDKSIQAISLSNQTDVLKDDTECQVCGWGLTENNEVPKELRCASVYAINRNVCQSNYNTSDVQFKITERMTCCGVTDPEKIASDSCSGDSGGPLVCNGQLYGCVSAGYSCGLKEYPGIYANIPSVRNWIQMIAGV